MHARDPHPAHPEELRRRVDDMENSLSWKITAPLRYLSKPLFRPKRDIPAIPQESSMTHTPDAAAAAVTAESPTLQAVCRHYQINPGFAHAALERFIGADYDRGLADFERFRARYENLMLQLDYTFLTNLRGSYLAEQARAWGVPDSIAQAPRTFLDVGFAYGGSVAAFAALGYEVTGIEISPDLARLGRLNLASTPSAATLLVGDFLSEEPLGGEARFDLITCCDVIEHVADPEAALRKIFRLLKPGGAAYIAYPTKLSMPYVRSDPHAQLFGLTLLDYYRARTAYTMYTGWPNFEVSDFFEPEWYLNIARTAGVRAEVLYDQTVPPPDPAAEIAELFAAYADWHKSAALKLEPLMRREISVEFARYAARMFEEFSRHTASNSLDLFARKWIDRLTRILIRKP